MANARCSIPECDEPRSTRGLCATHYMRWVRHRDKMDRSPIRYPRTDLCTVTDCLRPIEGRGYCAKHYQRWKKHGDPETVKIDWNTERRFRSKIVVDARGCWIWQGRDVNQVGHARWIVRGVRIGVHRWSYEHFIGPIPEGLVLDHLCRVPACVNPRHLEPVTQPVNVSRAPTAIPTINAAKSHCKYGHPLFGPNLIIRHYGRHPCRQCRKCVNRRAREYQQRKRAMRR